MYIYIYAYSNSYLSSSNHFPNNLLQRHHDLCSFFVWVRDVLSKAFRSLLRFTFIIHLQSGEYAEYGFKRTQYLHAFLL